MLSFVALCSLATESAEASYDRKSLMIYPLIAESAIFMTVELRRKARVFDTGIWSFRGGLLCLREKR